MGINNKCMTNENQPKKAIAVKIYTPVLDESVLAHLAFRQETISLGWRLSHVLCRCEQPRPPVIRAL